MQDESEPTKVFKVEKGLRQRIFHLGLPGATDKELLLPEFS